MCACVVNEAFSLSGGVLCVRRASGRGRGRGGRRGMAKTRSWGDTLAGNCKGGHATQCVGSPSPRVAPHRTAHPLTQITINRSRGYKRHGSEHRLYYGNRPALAEHLSQFDLEGLGTNLEGEGLTPSEGADSLLAVGKTVLSTCILCTPMPGKRPDADRCASHTAS